MNAPGKSWMRPGVAALAASFAAYLVPLVGPHAIWLVGEMLWRETVSHRAERPAAWVLTDWGAALAAQLVFGAICYWAFRKRSAARLALVLAAGVALVASLNALYLVVIPTRFLIEASTEPEKTPWPQDCVAPLATLPTNLTATARNALGEAGMALAQMDSGGYALLRAAGCSLTPIPLPANGNVAPAAVDVAGRVLASEWLNAEARQRYWYYPPGGEGVLLDWVAKDKNYDSPPLLSADGKSVAWIRRIAGTGPPLEQELRVETLDRSSARAVPLSGLGRGSYVLLAVDSAPGSALLARNLDEFLIAGFDGTIRWGPFQPTGVQPQPQTFVRFANGWAAWDAYREDEAYRVAWSFPRGSGTHTIPKGRGVNSGAVSPGGEYVAYSVTGIYSIGSVQDFVAVLRTSDGAEVFRKYLPRYMRTGVVFLGHDRFAYSDRESDHGVIRVVRTPGN